MTKSLSIPVFTNNYTQTQKDINKVNFAGHFDNVQQEDKAEFSKQKKEQNVSFTEGCGLVAKGFANKAVEIFKTIIKHPVQTVGAIALTTAALTALPLIGIASATGAGILAAGFAALAVGNGISHSIQAVKHNKDKKYGELRQDLKKIGGDSLDLALSLPFVPKAINSIKRQVKYTQNGLKPVFNKELWTNVKETKGLWNKVKEFVKGDLRIAYKQHTEEMGLKIAPELEFSELPKNKQGGYKSAEGKIIINSKRLSPFRSMSLDSTLRHELEHFTQYKTIARSENHGIAGIRQALENRSGPENIQTQVDRVKKAIDDFHNPKPTKNPVIKIIRPLVKLLFGKWYLKKCQKELAALQKTQERQDFNRFFTAKSGKILSPLLDFKKASTPSPKGSFNTKFYQEIIDQEGIIPDGSKESAQAAKYFAASSKYPNLNPFSFINNKAYRNNLLEVEARHPQKLYIKLRPSLKTNILQEASRIADNNQS